MIDELIKLSPVPVIFTNNLSVDYIGSYHHAKKLYDGDIVKEPFIKIRDDLKDYQKIGTLVHEIKHAQCVKKNCKCMRNPDKTEREVHAYMYELLWLLKHKQMEGLKELIEKIEYKAENNFTNQYGTSARQIVKSKLWKRCLKFIGE